MKQINFSVSNKDATQVAFILIQLNAKATTHKKIDLPSSDWVYNLYFDKTEILLYQFIFQLGNNLGKVGITPIDGITIKHIN